MRQGLQVEGSLQSVAEGAVQSQEVLQSCKQFAEGVLSFAKELIVLAGQVADAVLLCVGQERSATSQQEER